MTNKERQAEQAWDDFLADEADKDNEEQRKAIDAIKPLFEWRQTEKAVERELRKLDPKGRDGRYDRGSAGALRAWLLDHPGQAAFDNEHNLAGWLQSGGVTESYDALLDILKAAPEVAASLTYLGCLAVDAAAVRMAIERGQLDYDDVRPFLHVTPRSMSLKVDTPDKLPVDLKEQE